jgi:hypothetical protein
MTRKKPARKRAGFLVKYSGTCRVSNIAYFDLDGVKRRTLELPAVAAERRLRREDLHLDLSDAEPCRASGAAAAGRIVSAEHGVWQAACL